MKKSAVILVNVGAPDVPAAKPVGRFFKAILFGLPSSGSATIAVVVFAEVICDSVAGQKSS